MQLFSTIKKRVKNSISFLTDENTAKKIVNKIKVHERIWEIIIKWPNCDIVNW